MQDNTRAASNAQERAHLAREFVEFSWLGESFKHVSALQLTMARSLVLQGFEPQGPEVLRIFKLDAEQLAREAEERDIQRRARRTPGQVPEGKPLEARRAHVAVRILCSFVGRLHEPRLRLSNGEPLSSKAGALLAQAGLVDLGERDDVEAHPRAKKKKLRRVDSDVAKRVGGELVALERGERAAPDESTTPLPDDISGATRRNRRRAEDARAQLKEQQVYERQQKLERKAAAAGNQMRNPAGVVPLPLHEGRKARPIATDAEQALRFLLSLPRELRWALFLAGTDDGKRGRFCVEALRLYAFYAFLMWQSQAPRPCMRRAGFDRATEGLCREALAVSFVWNSRSRAPFHANSISAWVQALEEVGLVRRESPNADKNAYTGVTGWALNVYRMRNAEQLTELLEAFGIPSVPEGFDALLGQALSADAAPS